MDLVMGLNFVDYGEKESLVERVVIGKEGDRCFAL
jgi:hypothetical protein